MTKAEIGKILKQLRSASGMTQKEVADKIGRKQQIVGHWETGYSQPDANTLFSLCELYGVSVDEAFGFRKDGVSVYDSKFLKNYHSLTAAGKAHVDTVLQWELEHADQLRRARSAQDDPAAEVDIDAAVEDYRLRLEREKKARGRLSASSDTGTDGC